MKQTEKILERCIKAYEDNPDEFTEFEEEFLDNIEEVIKERHLTTTGINGGKGQLEILMEIYHEHC